MADCLTVLRLGTQQKKLVARYILLTMRRMKAQARSFWYVIIEHFWIIREHFSGPRATMTPVHKVVDLWCYQTRLSTSIQDFAYCARGLRHLFSSLTPESSSSITPTFFLNLKFTFEQFHFSNLILNKSNDKYLNNDKDHLNIFYKVSCYIKLL